jgi:UDP-N-acetylmuramoylalanine--D-glutamate ligase
MEKKLVVLGSGESGTGAALLAKKQGYRVLVSDRSTIKKRYRDVLTNNEIEFEEGNHSVARILEAELIVKSPGIPDNAAVVVTAKERGIRVISEIEFASWFTAANLIGVTGTNGKTTTVTLTQHLLAQAGLSSVLAGNVGKSFAEAVATQSPDHFVLELSSFQLDGIEDFRPHIAALINISPDHLDRYDSYDDYVAAKFRIAMNQQEDDYFIYDADDEAIASGMDRHPVRSQKLPFSVSRPLEKGAFIEEDQLTIKLNNKEHIMPISTLGLQGQHNTKNAMAAATVATLLKIRKETIRESLANFQGVEHRLERVLKINNVLYINDSKATNVNATFYALDSMTTPTVWIVGGVDKGNDYEQLLPLVNEKVKAIICLGVDNEKLVKHFGNCVDMMVETDSMRGAVQLAYKLAGRGDTVLLSPACASFDLFDNYEDRGRQFKEAVRNL